MSILYSKNGFTPLITAANNEDMAIFKHLLKWKADVDTHGIVSHDCSVHNVSKK